MKAKIICTTILVEKSPQALPLGAACVASAIKHSALTKDYCEVSLKHFYPEDKEAGIVKVLLAEFGDEALNRGDRLDDNGETCTNGDRLLYKGDRPCICAFSVFVWNRVKIEKISRELRKKGIICIAGGPEITACARDKGAKLTNGDRPDFESSFDYIVCGEGEISVPKLIKKIVEQWGQTSLTLKQWGQPSSSSSSKTTTLTASPQLSEELYPSPYLDGTLNPNDFGGVLWELARGCPFKCSYCYESKGEKNVRLFPMERIEKELELFAKKDVPQVFVLDPTYNADKNRALQLLNLIAKKTPRTFYYFEARAEFIDRQLAQAFTRLSCAVQIGLQSADENVLQLVNRPFNRKVFVRNIGFLNEAGVIFGFDLIYGLPGENLAGFKNGIDFAISLYPNNLELFCLSVLPGTDLADRAEELHLNYERKPPYHVINTDKYSKADMIAAQKLSEACTFFYNDGRAVPWFNTICRALKIKPSEFFQRFAETGIPGRYSNQKQKLGQKAEDCDCCGHTEHKAIEKEQIDFIITLLKLKKLDRLIKACRNIITFNGAISRVQDTGKKETITLDYEPEYIDSQYASDLQFFAANIPSKKTIVEVFKNGRFADYRILKNTQKNVQMNVQKNANKGDSDKFSNHKK